MSERTYDTIVVGLGAMGSAAAYHLTRRGQRVLGLDAFPAGHTLGSSHGETRIIRMAYFEHPDYVPLLRRAWQLWAELEAAAGTQLLMLTGGLFVGPPDGDLVSGSRRSAKIHHLAHTVLDADEIRHRFPMFHPADDDTALFEEQAGVLLPERCVETHLALAATAGADLRHAEAVTAWRHDGRGVRVDTVAGHYTADALVVTAGAWAGKLLADLGLPLQPERIPLFWFEPVRNAQVFEIGAMPVWIWQAADEGDFYGVPHLGWPGVKIGKHHSGSFVDADRVAREVSAEDERPLRAFLERRLPDLAGRVAQAKVCLYTNTPDTHFVIDRHPAYSNVAYAAGFSGHGFKFASVVGEILADLVTSGHAAPEAAFLRARPERFAARGAMAAESTPRP